MTEDEATIINYALTDIGVGPMFSIDDDSDLAEQIAHCWPRVVDRAFGMASLGWSFARKTFQNNRHAATPENGFQYGFDLPGGRIGNPVMIKDSPRSRTPVRDFTIEAGKLYCDCAATWSLCKVYVDPSIWPPEWRDAFVVALAGYLAVPVLQDTQMREDKLTEAFGTPSQGGSGGIFGRLLATDVGSSPVGESQSIEDPLSNARSTGVMTSYPWHGRF